MTGQRERPWPPPPDRFTIMKTDPDDQPPSHDPENPWIVVHPTGVAGARRRITSYPDQPAALQFVNAQPEVRRRRRTPRR